MLRPYRGIMPTVPESAYVDPSAQLIGDVTLGERSSVWCNTTLRGDVNAIRIGRETSIQDNSVLHGELDLYQVVVGNRVTVGHSVVLHGCTVEDDALIGIGAIILNGARIGQGAIVAAGSLVPEGMEIPAGTLAMGSPAKVRREITPAERDRFAKNAQNYVRYRANYLAETATEREAP